MDGALVGVGGGGVLGSFTVAQKFLVFASCYEHLFCHKIGTK